MVNIVLFFFRLNFFSIFLPIFHKNEDKDLDGKTLPAQTGPQNSIASFGLSILESKVLNFANQLFTFMGCGCTTSRKGRFTGSCT